MALLARARFPSGLDRTEGAPFSQENAAEHPQFDSVALAARLIPVPFPPVLSSRPLVCHNYSRECEVSADHCTFPALTLRVSLRLIFARLGWGVRRGSLS